MDAPTAHCTLHDLGDHSVEKARLRERLLVQHHLQLTGGRRDHVQREALEGLRRFRCHKLPQLRHGIGFLGLDNHVAISVEELDHQRRAG